MGGEGGQWGDVGLSLRGALICDLGSPLTAGDAVGCGAQREGVGGEVLVQGGRPPSGRFLSGAAAPRGGGGRPRRPSGFLHALGAGGGPRPEMRARLSDLGGGP